jgi:hypothetical protein
MGVKVQAKNRGLGDKIPEEGAPCPTGAPELLLPDAKAPLSRKGKAA